MRFQITLTHSNRSHINILYIIIISRHPHPDHPVQCVAILTVDSRHMPLEMQINDSTVRKLTLLGFCGCQIIPHCSDNDFLTSLSLYQYLRLQNE